MGGHWVQGHVDGLARLLKRVGRRAAVRVRDRAARRDSKPAWWRRARSTLDGVSLTVAGLLDALLHRRAHPAHPRSHDARRGAAGRRLPLRGRHPRQVHRPRARAPRRRLEPDRAVSWREHAPEPARLWIRWSPRRWPAPAAPCARPRGAPPALAGDRGGPCRELATPAPPRADLVYLPPVPPGLAAGRASARRALAPPACRSLAQERRRVPARETAGADSGRST